MIAGITSIVNDAAIRTNLIQAATMFVLQPLLRYEPVRRRNYEAQNVVAQRQSIVMFSPITKRVSQLEARQTLLEADFTLLRYQQESREVSKGLA